MYRTKEEKMDCFLTKGISLLSFFVNSAEDKISQ